MARRAGDADEDPYEAGTALQRAYMRTLQVDASGQIEVEKLDEMPDDDVPDKDDKGRFTWEQY